MTLGELSHGRSPLGWAASAVLGHLLRKSMENGKPDLNILFQYNMPLRALAKMTNGAVSMGMGDGIVMEVSACRYGIVRGYLFRPVEKSRLVGDL